MNDNENEKVMQQLPLIEEFPDIQYIIQHSPTPITFCLFQHFFTNNILNITTLLQIRQSHDAFSRNLQSNSHQIANRNNNITQEINGNAINKLITEITADNISENQRRRRRDRWEGRKRLELLSNNNTLGKIICFICIIKISY